MVRLSLQFIMITCLVPLHMNAQKERTVKLKSQPATLAEFIKLKADVAKNPQGGVAMFLLALKLYVQDPLVGEPCIILMSDRQNIYRSKEVGNYQGKKLKRSKMSLIQTQLHRFPHIPNSFFEGARPTNDYTPDRPLKLKLRPSPTWEPKIADRVKFYLQSSGSAMHSPRPITVQKGEDGIWRVSEMDEVLASIEMP